MSLFGFAACKPCGGSESADPAKDTVKFFVPGTENMSEDKENMSPQMNEEEVASLAAKEKREREAQEKRERERAEAEAKYQRDLVERKRAEEVQRQLEEEARIQREQEQRRKDEEARRIAEEETRRQAQEAEEERIREETARCEREAREAEEAAEKKQKVEDFLKQHGYSGINAKRKSKFGRFKFALHTAVKHNPDLVPLLLELGAEPSNKNSAGLTPYEYAKKLKSSCESALKSAS